MVTAKLSFKQQVLRTREEAIVTAANRLLAEKGFDLMTVDEVAAEVGIAKASLYKHFASKEALAAAAMVRLMDRALTQVRSQPVSEPADGKSALTLLKACVKWMLQLQLAGEMPSLPSQNSTLRAALLMHSPYLERLVALSEVLGGWIVLAQQAGLLRPSLPAELILYTFFAKACDPVVSVMKASANYTDDQIVALLLETCFDGVC